MCDWSVQVTFLTVYQWCDMTFLCIECVLSVYSPPACTVEGDQFEDVIKNQIGAV